MIRQSVAAALVMAAIAFAGCKNTPEKEITMTTAKKRKADIRLAGTGMVVINWGDGSAPETVTLSAYDRRFISRSYFHTFSGTTSHTIVIDGKNITHPACGELQLTALGVSKNTVLTYLDCSLNWLPAGGLNTLFGTLPGNAGSKTIYIGDNPADDGCDRSIVTGKGWEVK